MATKDSVEGSPALKGLKPPKSGSVENILASKDPIRFDWENKWLKGKPNLFIQFRNLKFYCLH